MIASIDSPDGKGSSRSTASFFQLFWGVLVITMVVSDSITTLFGAVNFLSFGFLGAVNAQSAE